MIYSFFFLFFFLQLSQVESALVAAGENEDLNKLKTDLKELIALTERKKYFYTIFNFE